MYVFSSFVQTHLLSELSTHGIPAIT